MWEEAQKLGGIDPDFRRRDLWDSIEAGSFPEWDFGIKVFPDNDDQTFDGIDLLDATKLVPEELAPVQIIGRLTLNCNPTNFFAETEQVAFCTSHVRRGIDFTDDPLLQARNFSYLDTQLSRLGGPNFDQLPIDRPHSPVNTRCPVLRVDLVARDPSVNRSVIALHTPLLDGRMPGLTLLPGPLFADHTGPQSRDDRK